MAFQQQLAEFKKRLFDQLPHNDAYEINDCLQAWILESANLDKLKSSDVLKFRRVLSTKGVSQTNIQAVQGILFDIVVKQTYSQSPTEPTTTASSTQAPLSSPSFAQSPATSLSHLKTQAQLSDKLFIFNALFKQVCQQISFDNSTHTRHFFSDLAESCHTLHCSHTTRQHLQQWCQQSGTSEFVYDDASVDELSEVVRSAYVICCELLGPVKSDQYFSQALRQTSMLPAAQQFNPQQFF